MRAHVHVRCRRGRCGAEQVHRRDAVGGDCALSHTTTPPPPPPDDGPTAPANLRTTSVTQTAVSLAWDSSTDPDGVSGYQIFRDGTKIGEGPGIHGGFTNTWNDTGRTCGTAYDYAVAGVDTTGTVGPKSTLRVTTSACDPATPPPPPPTATTPPPPPPPTTGSTAPTAPPNLRTTSVTQTAVSLAWDSSTDPDGVSGYQIFRDGTKIGEGPATNTWNDTGRTCGTAYDYAVAGVDTTGTVGPKSTTLHVTTSACDPATHPPPPAADTTAPSKPANVTAGTRTATSIALSWQPSSDASASSTTACIAAGRASGRPRPQRGSSAG